MAKAEEKEPEPPMVDVLRKAIRASGRTLYALSEECKVDRSRLSRFLRGERTITLDAAGRICETLGITLDVPEELQQAPAEPLPEKPPAATPKPPAKKTKGGKK